MQSVELIMAQSKQKTICLNLIWFSFLCYLPQSACGIQDFVITQFDGSEISGKISQIDDQRMVTVTDVSSALKLDDIISIESGKSAKRLPEFDATIHLVGGGQLYVTNPQIADEKVTFRSGTTLSEVPLQSLRAIVWQQTTAVARQMGNPSADKDAVLVDTPDGERGVEGIVEQLDEERLQINFQSRSRSIGVTRINAIIMADLGLDPPTGPIATITMIDDSSVVGAISNWYEGKLSVQLTGGFASLAASEIVSVAIPSDRLLFLSDLDPVDVQQKTDFAVFRPWRKDRSVENNPLTIRYGNTDKVVKFEKGLGTQAFSSLTFENIGGFDRFNAIVGIDAETQGRGDCQMLVLGDGIELWSQRVRGSENPIEVEVDIDGINQVTLVVYPGANFDLGDHANWGNARFAKSHRLTLRDRPSFRDGWTRVKSF